MQLFFNGKLENPSNKPDNIIDNEINAINQDILKAKEKHGKTEPDFAMVRGPQLTTLPLDGVSEFVALDEDMDDDPRPISETITIPSHIQELRRRVGGWNGLFHKVLNNLDSRFQIKDPELKQAWELHEALVMRRTKDANIKPSDIFKINLGQFAHHRKVLQELQQLPTDLERQKKYIDQRKLLLLSMVKDLQVPINYLEAALPPLNEVEGFQKMPVAPEPPSKEIVDKVGDVLQRELFADSEPLVTYVWSQLNGNEDFDARAYMCIADEQVQQMSGKYVGRPELQEYQVSSVVQNIINSANSRAKLAGAELHAFDQGLLPAVYNVCKLLAAKGPPKTQNTEEKRYVHIDEKAEKKTQTDAKKKATKQNKTKQHSQPLSPMVSEYDMEDTLSPAMSEFDLADTQPVQQINSKYIEDVVHGRLVKKSIVRVRKLLPRWWTADGKNFSKMYSYQILVKWKRDGYKRPTFEWHKASEYKGSAEAFEKSKGDNAHWVTGTKADLKGTQWDNMKLGGVAFGPRDPKKEYKNDATCHVLLYNTLETPFTWKWFPISMLRTQFGEKRVNNERDRWCHASGQDIPRKGSSKAGQMYEKLRRKTESTKRTGRKRHIVEDDDEDEDGEDLDDSRDRDDHEQDEPMTYVSQLIHNHEYTDKYIDQVNVREWMTSLMILLRLRKLNLLNMREEQENCTRRYTGTKKRNSDCSVLYEPFGKKI